MEQTLQRLGHKALAIHGDMTQEQRTRALHAFKEGSTPLTLTPNPYPNPNPDPDPNPNPKPHP